MFIQQFNSKVTLKSTSVNKVEVRWDKSEVKADYIFSNPGFYNRYHKNKSTDPK